MKVRADRPKTSISDSYPTVEKLHSGLPEKTLVLQGSTDPPGTLSGSMNRPSRDPVRIYEQTLQGPCKDL